MSRPHASRPSIVRTAGPAVALATASLLLAGCGSTDRDQDTERAATSTGTAPVGRPIDARTPPQTVLADAAHALVRATSLHVSLRQRDADGEVGFEADIAANGDARVTVGQGEGTLRLIKTGSSAVYINADRAFWRSTSRADGKAIASRLAGRWVRTRPGQVSDLDEVFTQLNPTHLAVCLGTGTGTLERAGTATVGGRRAYVIADRGDRPGTTPGRLYVAADGSAVPLRVTETGERRPGGRVDRSCDDPDDTTTRSDATLSRYDAPLRITAPPNAVDAADLFGGGRGETT